MSGEWGEGGDEVGRDREGGVQVRGRDAALGHFMSDVRESFVMRTGMDECRQASRGKNKAP